MITTIMDIIEDSKECVPSENRSMEIPVEKLIVKNNLSILAEVATLGTLIFSLGYVEEEDNIPPSSLMKEAKNKKETSKQDIVPEKDPIVETHEDTIPLDLETQEFEKEIENNDTFYESMAERATI